MTADWAARIRDNFPELDFNKTAVCRSPIDGVTGRQPTVVVAVAVPQNDGVGKRSQVRACSKHHRGTTMDYYAGIDVSLESASLCVVDATGRIVREAKVASEREILIGWFHALGLANDADRA